MQRNPTQRSLARLKADLRAAGVTQQRIADEAGVTKPSVNHVLAGRAVSKNVIATAERLLAEAKERLQRANGHAPGAIPAAARAVARGGADRAGRPAGNGGRAGARAVDPARDGRAARSVASTAGGR